MASVTGMVTGNLTDLNLQQSLRVGDTLDPGTQGQVLISNGEGNATEWGTNSTIVPNALTAGTNITYSSGNASWDGGVADTINAASTTYTASSGMKLIGNAFLTDNDGTTINNSGGTGAQNQVLKVPNALTAGTNVTFSSGTTYDGSAAITINSTDTNTTYSAGDGISIGGTVIETKIDEDTIDYDGSGTMEVVKVPNGLSAGTNLSFTSGSTFDGDAARTINLDSAPTNLDLSDSTNIISPYFFHNVYDPSSSDFDALSTTYSALLLSNVNVNIVAKQTSLCVELLCFNYGSSSNRFTYCRLTDNGGTEFSSGTNQGGYGTGTVNTERLVHGMDETDKQIFRITWYIQGLTIGNTYTFNPQARTSGTFNYIAAGGSYPATILRGYYLPTTSGGGGGGGA